MKPEKQKIAEAILLLRILHQDSNILGNLKLQKEVFLSELNLLRSKMGGLYYKFFRYTLGAYSPELAESFKLLVERGFVYKSSFKLTDRGMYLVEFTEGAIKDYRHNAKILSNIDSTVKQYKHYNGMQLKRIVYDLKLEFDDMPGKKVRVEDIPTFFDILVPEHSEVSFSLEIPAHILEDIKTELAMDESSWEALGKEDPKVLKRSKRRLLAALNV